MSSGSTSQSFSNRPRYIPVYKRLDHEYDINESTVDVPYDDGNTNLELGDPNVGGQPPSFGAMVNVAVTQTSDGTVDLYNHPEGPSLSDVNKQGSSQIGTSETYGGGQPPSVGDMAKVVVSQTSDGVDPYNHPKGPSLSDVNQPRSSQIGTSETYGGGQPPSVGAIANVVVSQTSNGVDPYNHQSDLYHQMESSCWPESLSNNRIKAIQELTQGQKLTNTLREMLEQPGKIEADPMLVDGVVEQILGMFANTLSIFSSPSSNETSHIPTLEKRSPNLSDVNQPRWSQIGTSKTYGGGQPPSVGAMAKVVVSQTSDGVDPYNHPKGTSLISDVNQRNSSQNGTSNQDIVMLDAPGAQELLGMSS